MAFARLHTLILVYLHMAFFALCWGVERVDGLTALRLGVAALTMTFCYINATAVNDLSDEAVDRVNLAGEPDRPLASGTAGRGQVWAVGLGAAVICLAAAALVSPWAVLAAAVMLVLNAVYSLPPVRISGRGALAQILLPLEYCAFPALLTALAAGTGGDRTASDGGVAVYWLMVACMYMIFVGRVFLKDIRDEAGDRATGKRTFTVRHGRRAAIVWSAATTVAGTVALSVVMFLFYDVGPGYVFGFCALSLTGQLVALRQADRAPDTAEAVLHTGVYGRWISMKVFFYVMIMSLVRSGASPLTEEVVLGGTALAIVCNVAMLYRNIADQRLSRRIAGSTPP